MSDRVRSGAIATSITVNDLIVLAWRGLRRRAAAPVPPAEPTSLS